MGDFARGKQPACPHFLLCSSYSGVYRPSPDSNNTPHRGARTYITTLFFCITKMGISPEISISGGNPSLQRVHSLQWHSEVILHCTNTRVLNEALGQSVHVYSSVHPGQGWTGCSTSPSAVCLRCAYCCAFLTFLFTCLNALPGKLVQTDDVIQKHAWQSWHRDGTFSGSWLICNTTVKGWKEVERTGRKWEE